MSKMACFRTLRGCESSPRNGCEGGVQAGQVKSPRAAVTTDQLPSVLAHGALVVVAVSLQRKHEAHSGSEPWQEVAGERMDYRVCGWLPLVVKDFPPGSKRAACLPRLAARMKHAADFDTRPGTSCHVTRQSGHMMSDCF